MFNAFEAELMNINNPRVLMGPLGTTSYTHLGPEHISRVKVLLMRTFEDTYGFNQQNFIHNFEQHLVGNIPGQHPVPFNNHDLRNIEHPEARLLQELVIDGYNEGIRVRQFHEDIAWNNFSDFTLSNPMTSPRHPSAENPNEPFLRRCRILANAMFILKVYGNRFIRSETLLRIFDQGEEFGCDASRKAELIGNIHKMTPVEMWAPPGNLVVTKWIPEISAEERLYEGWYFQVENMIV